MPATTTFQPQIAENYNVSHDHHMVYNLFVNTYYCRYNSDTEETDDRQDDTTVTSFLHTPSFCHVAFLQETREGYFISVAFTPSLLFY